MTRTRTLLTVALTSLTLTLQAGCESIQPPPTPSESPTAERAMTMQDLDAQLLRQFREQWPSEQISAVRIRGFLQPPREGAVRIDLRVEWITRAEDTQIRSMHTAVTLYRAASEYLVGTLEVKDKAPVNVMLKFG